MCYTLSIAKKAMSFFMPIQQEMKKDHTGRGVSGALYLQSATAGVVSSFEGRIRTVCTDFDVC